MAAGWSDLQPLWSDSSVGAKSISYYNH